MNPTQWHTLLVVLILVTAGALAGYIKWLNSSVAGSSKKYVFSGIGGAVLVPLLLNTLSSDLVKKASLPDTGNYFIFAGFCFIAGYFSDRFINSLADKVMRDLEATRVQVAKTATDVARNEQQLQVLVENESDPFTDEKVNGLPEQELTPVGTRKDEDMDAMMKQIVLSFTGKYKFRTVKGVSQQLCYSPHIVRTIMDQMQETGVLKTLKTKEEVLLYALTRFGLQLAERYKTE